MGLFSKKEPDISKPFIDKYYVERIVNLCKDNLIEEEYIGRCREDDEDLCVSQFLNIHSITVYNTFEDAIYWSFQKVTEIVLIEDGLTDKQIKYFHNYVKEKMSDSLYRGKWKRLYEGRNQYYSPGDLKEGDYNKVFTNPYDFENYDTYCEAIREWNEHYAIKFTCMKDYEWEPNFFVEDFLKKKRRDIYLDFKFPEGKPVLWSPPLPDMCYIETSL